MINDYQHGMAAIPCCVMKERKCGSAPPAPPAPAVPTKPLKNTKPSLELPERVSFVADESMDIFALAIIPHRLLR